MNWFVIKDPERRKEERTAAADSTTLNSSVRRARVAALWL
jgi:hypothetical protein